MQLKELIGYVILLTRNRLLLDASGTLLIGNEFLFQVIGAKVVTNARSPGARCFGIITMATSEEASKCIQHLHHTELHGRMISVEKVSISVK